MKHFEEHRPTTALVTGSAVRVGKSVALELARQGHNIVVHANRSVAEAEQTAHEIESLGVESIVVTADQQDPRQILAACEQSWQHFGKVDILVNSASTWPRYDLESDGEAEYDAALDVNLKGPFFWSQILGRKMKQRSWAAIVSIGDVACTRPWVDFIPYSLAKSGIRTMTVGLAKALAPAVRVNAIEPGPILYPDDYPEEMRQADRDACLTGKEGEPQDIANAVAYFVNNPNVTGAILPVDCGIRLSR